MELTELDKNRTRWSSLTSWPVEETGRAPSRWTRISRAGYSVPASHFPDDIKPPVTTHGDGEGGELNEYVSASCFREVPDIDQVFFERFKAYHLHKDESVERRVLRAAHYMAPMGVQAGLQRQPTMLGFGTPRRAIEMQIEDTTIIGVQRIMLAKKSYGFIEFCGLLRYLQRWARAPRIEDVRLGTW